MLVDAARCARDCDACVRACDDEHGLEPVHGPATDPRWIHKVTLRDRATGRISTLPLMCQHCADPPCVDVCPTGASFRRADGIVLVDKHTCIGCRYCVMACPFQARAFVHEAVENPRPWSPRGKGTVESCNLCVHRIDAGEGRDPACVEACAAAGHRALVFGDLNDSESPVAKALAERPERGAPPRLRLGYGRALSEHLSDPQRAPTNQGRIRKMANDRSHALSLLRAAMASRGAEFRVGQWEAIDALVNRRERLLVVQRTGWGKSSVYFIATRILRDRGRGPTLIVSPLLALMRNQIEAAGRLRIRALSINSTNRREWPDLRRAVLDDEADVLLISPERLANDDFIEDVLLPIAGTIGLLVVDEAHCISDWGHDFRPDYRRLVNVLRRMPDNLPILGTTATANDRVIADVQAQLGGVRVQRGSLMRETLALQTMRLPSQAARLAWLADHVDSLPGTGIVYALTKRDANQVAGWLEEHGIQARAYYSDVTHEEFEDSNTYRQHLEDQLLRNEIKALVATTALGMGYDKPDLGFVVHYQAPSSIVAYYQQVGRAGRNIPHAVGVLMAGNEKTTDITPAKDVRATKTRRSCESDGGSAWQNTTADTIANPHKNAPKMKAHSERANMMQRTPPNGMTV